MLVVQIAFDIDENRFTRHDVAQEAKTQTFECNGFTRNHVFRALVRFGKTDTEGPDTVRIAESENTGIGDMGNGSVSAANPFMQYGNGLEECCRVQRITAGRFLDFMCQHV